MCVNRNLKLQTADQIEMKSVPAESGILKFLTDHTETRRTGPAANITESDVIADLLENWSDNIDEIRMQIAKSCSEKISGTIGKLIDFTVSSGVVSGKKELALLNAVSYGFTKEVKKLIDAGADANAKSKVDGITCLHLAAPNGHAEIVNILIQSGARINESICLFKDTPLHLAIKHGHEDAVESLISAGANVNATNGIKDTPLSIASKLGFSGIVDKLILAGAKVSTVDKIKGFPTLHEVIKYGHLKVMKSLIKADVILDGSNQADNLTPLHLASLGDHLTVLGALMMAGAKLNVKEKNQGFTPLHVAAKEGRTAIVNALIKAGAKTKLKDTEGRTPLQIAKQNRHESAVPTLKSTKSDNENSKVICNNSIVSIKFGLLPISFNGERSVSI